MQGKVDLDWDDAGVFPERVYPDTTFIFTRMAEATWEMVAPSQGGRVLDIGCGRAVDALELARRGGKAVGLDPSGKMIREAKGYISDGEVALVRGIGEALPFKRHSLDKVMCKGALDHFLDPAMTMEEMSQVLKPEGEAIIAIANFESLSCRLGRLWYPIAKRFNRARDERPPWEIPPDHTCKFDYRLLRRLADRHFQVKETIGISLLWTAPYWGKTLALLPRGVSATILALLDRIARRFPSLSDVIVIKGTPKGITMKNGRPATQGVCPTCGTKMFRIGKS
ncbi:MAG: methyltransferase domain-containing protein [Dehalococcoidia bacterium]